MSRFQSNALRKLIFARIPQPYFTLDQKIQICAALFQLYHCVWKNSSECVKVFKNDVFKDNLLQRNIKSMAAGNPAFSA